MSQKPCFGKRTKAYKKCEEPECPKLTECSATTIINTLLKDGNRVFTRRGEIVLVDVK